MQQLALLHPGINLYRGTAAAQIHPTHSSFLENQLKEATQSALQQARQVNLMTKVFTIAT